ncbi:hypothetical protein [Thalassoglobus polymorphus]|uniref:Uncharacterized protein n=1 Tax=Thalassoglobus polymorphus TaxID=2527994 RepID=A0A517QI48_9PLAN|nr:hypothetical protein [Thalassoglobus polymorphus]QDT31311.1 hypothetical protein Mal48_05440 [Thalassoglobus polymorphus]
MKHIIATCLCLVSVNLGQADDSPQTYGLVKVPSSAYPDPTEQSETARLKTLRENIQAAEQLLTQKDYKTFLLKYADPFWLSRMSVEENATLEETVATLAQNDMQRIGPKILETISATEANAPTWRLGGRFAAFSAKRRTQIGETWVYYEGRWRILPPIG